MDKLKETSKCINCGFCLSSCPDYALKQTELSSPRGRVRAIHIASLDTSIQVPSDLSQPCIGCDACYKSCPVVIDFRSLFGS